MFPNDSITVWREISGITTVDLTPTGNYTILGVAMQQENVASDTDLRCGTDVVARNYGTNFSFVPLNYQCTNKIVNLSKTGNDKASVIVTYVPYLTSGYSTTTTGYNPTSEIATTTDVKIYGSISAGEVIISTLLIMIIFVKLLQLLALALSKITTKRKYMQYSGGDVPIDED